VTRADAQLVRYCELVRRWSDRIDLVAEGDLGRFRIRHIDDSLRALPLLESLPPGPVIDVGSGAGLPGIPLAIRSPDRLVRLLEPRMKRAAFLEEVIRELDLSCEVVTLEAGIAAGRAELAHGHVLATARALAPPVRAFEMALPFVTRGGSAAVWHGPDAELPPIAEEWSRGIAIVRAG
jgi:16S rRNA (guanine527-N7)-methyltransferase